MAAVTLTQLSLLEPRARRADPPTSRAAAAAQRGGVPRAIVAVLNDVRGGLTDDALCDRLPDLHPATVKTARSRLAKSGLVVDTGRTARSHRGCDMTIWRLNRNAL